MHRLIIPLSAELMVKQLVVSGIDDLQLECRQRANDSRARDGEVLKLSRVILAALLTLAQMIYY